MKILQVAPYYPPYSGGQETFVQNLIKTLLKLNVEVEVATSDWPQSSESSQLECPMHRYRCIARPLRNPITPGLLGIVSELHEFDLVHAHNEYAFSTLLMAALRRRKKFRLLLTSHGKLRLGASGPDNLVNLYSRFVEPYVLRSPDLVVALSPSDVVRLERLGVRPDRLRVIPNALDYEVLSATPREVQLFRNRHGLGNSTVILFVGPIIMRKRPDVALRAFDSLCRRRRDISLVLVGDGPDFEATRKMAGSIGAEDRVVFTGLISRKHLAAAYAAAAVAVLPSSSEGLPTAILEALFMGTPVIASELQSIRDWLADYVLFFPHGRPDELASRIEEVLDNHEAYLRRVRPARNSIKTLFGWQSVGSSYLALYEELIDAGR